MSVSVLIPAHNEQHWLNRTIQNIFDTATGEIEVCVVLNGYSQPVDTAKGDVKIINSEENTGERAAMNAGAKVAEGTHLLRIDAHCDFSPTGWDQMLVDVTGERDMTQSILTATDGHWNRIKGHWYERTRLLPTMEAKWEKPNRDHSKDTVVPNMSSTGCGFMLRRDFYWEIGGANENYPKMGAIGEEFAVKTWLNGGTVQTRTDVIIGHIFGDELTKIDGIKRGYSTDGVLESRKALVRDFGSRYNEIRDKFPDLDWEETHKLKPTSNNVRDTRGVTVNREDVTTTKDQNGKVIRILTEYFRYDWFPKDHPDEKFWTENQIRDKYAPLADKYDEKVEVLNEHGEMVEFRQSDT